MTDRVRVLIVDDHTAFAESLRDVLARRDTVEIVGTAATASEAVVRAIEERPNVILMDQRLPDGTGPQAAARILASNVDTAVVMLTGGGSPDEMLEAVEAGVCGYLLKTARVAEIVDAVERAATGEMLIPADTLHALLQRARTRARDAQERTRVAGSLTPREREVLQAMAHGRSTEAIAQELTVTRQTARGYVQTVLEKLGAHSRLEAVLRAQELGILTE